MLDFSKPETKDEFQASGSLVAGGAIPAILTQERLAREHLLAHGCIVQMNDKYQLVNCALDAITLGIHRNQNKREIFPRIVFHDTEYRSYRRNDLAE